MKSIVAMEWFARLSRVSLIGIGLAMSGLTFADQGAWLDQSLSSDQRAVALVAAMTVDEKLQLVHGSIPGMMHPRPSDLVLGGGYIPGIKRLGVPSIQETDASLGVANLFNLRKNDVATAMPSGLALASTFDPDLAYAGGKMIGSEARAKKFNVMLAGGMNLVREARCGRAFEYLGEDPLLAGVLAGGQIKGVQSNAIVSTAKHFALNGQESGRMYANSKINENAARESDLLAFEIALELGQPGSVMAAYNQVNGTYSSESDWLLNEVLKKDWAYKGWVMSDWGSVHNTNAANAGLDQQSGEQLDKHPYFGAPLKAAVDSGELPKSRLDDMAQRIVRSLIDVGAFDRPVSDATEIDYAAHADVAQRVEEQGMVLLKNKGGALPLRSDVKSIAVIGGHADVGVLSGGGSSQVRPVGGPGFEDKVQGMSRPWYDPSSPLAALKAHWPAAKVEFGDGVDLIAAQKLAKSSEVAIVFATQWRTEGSDVLSLSLPGRQDGLIEAVAKANPNTVVVLETGGAVLMPWLGEVRAVLEAWYPGQRGGEAIGAVLAGDVNPAGRLPITFPKSESQLPRPKLDGLDLGLKAAFDSHLPNVKIFDVDYNIEGANVGYKWFEQRRMQPLFAFGYGMSFTKFRYTKLKVAGGETIQASVEVQNIGSRRGIATPQFYVAISTRGSKPIRRLIGWQRVDLKPGERRAVSIEADPRLLAEFDSAIPAWRIKEGHVRVNVGDYAGDTRTGVAVFVADRTLKP